MGNYYLFLMEREEKFKLKNTEYRREIGQKLSVAFREIAGRFGSIRRIYVFGSFIQGNFNHFSDIDMYAEGLGAEDYFEVKRLIEEMVGVDIDLFNDTDKTEFLERVKKRGEILYERKTGAVDC